jgi:hypothetical protein
MDLMNLSKKSEERQQKETAKKLLLVVDKIVQLLKDETLQVYECKIITSLLAQRLNNIVENFVSPKYLNHLDQRVGS